MSINTLIEIAYYFGLALMFSVLVCGCWRLTRGPTTLDRLLGLDTFTVSIVGLVAVYSIRANTAEYVELILIVTALGFFTTVCFYYYLSQPRKKGGEDFNLEGKS